MGGGYLSPFHLAFSLDKSRMFVSVLCPTGARSGTCVVGTSNWKIIKTFEDIGPDRQTMVETYDGKYVFQPFSGYQRVEWDFVLTQDNLNRGGIMPKFRGLYDCVIVPYRS